MTFLILDLIFCGVMLVSTLTLYILNRKLIKTARSRAELLDKVNKIADDNWKLVELLDDRRHDRATAMKQGKAEVAEKTELCVPCFDVFYRGKLDNYLVKRFFYDPEDPDDRDYKRIHAEEVAEMLNEKP